MDDFIFLGPPGHTSCGSNLALVHAICSELGFPVAEDKSEGPDTSLTFLGIEIDTIKLKL